MIFLIFGDFYPNFFGMKPPPLPHARDGDSEETLRRIGGFYILFGLLAVPGILILSAQHHLFDQFFASIGSLYGASEYLQFKRIFEILSWAILIMTIIHLIAFIWIGCCFRKHDNYFACVAAALLCCLSVPLGTILGILSLINLNSPESKELFEKG
ncbi:MAG: hypothetical protein AAF212_03060 [Verrucomicrobiota bacterium]